MTFSTFIARASPFGDDEKCAFLDAKRREYARFHSAENFSARFHGGESGGESVLLPTFIADDRMA